MKFPTGRFQHFENQSFLQGDKYDHENMKAMMMGIIKHSQSTQSNKFAISLQYFQKKVGIDQNIYKLNYCFLMKVARHVQSTQKREFVKFLQYIKKKYHN